MHIFLRLVLYSAIALLNTATNRTAYDCPNARKGALFNKIKRSKTALLRAAVSHRRLITLWCNYGLEPKQGSLQMYENNKIKRGKIAFCQAAASRCTLIILWSNCCKSQSKTLCNSLGIIKYPPPKTAFFGERTYKIRCADFPNEWGLPNEWGGSA